MKLSGKLLGAEIMALSLRAVSSDNNEYHSREGCDSCEVASSCLSLKKGCLEPVLGFGFTKLGERYQIQRLLRKVQYEDKGSGVGPVYLKRVRNAANNCRV